ncbi:MAG: WD40 repeat domain-containing protein [Candidatus Wallbacteria bacterium]|nr:WD40 repeat domain-containing protein [Candidatus Wallbacteria bacterium]
MRVDLRAKDAVLSASALSPDGKWLATSDGEKCIRLWAIPPAAPAPAALLLEGHTAPVLTLAFSADSRFLASGAADDCARVWDVGDLHSPPRVLTGHLDWVKKVVFGARAEHLYTASADGTARVWDLSPQPRPTRVLSNGGRSVRTVAASADGAWAVTLTEGDLEPSLWNLRAKASSEKPVRLLGFVLPPTGLAFSPDSRWLAVGGREHELRLYDMNSEEPGVADTVLTMQGAELTAMAFSPNGKWLATASHSPTATLWELSLAREAYHRRELRGIGEPLSSIEFGPRGRFVAALTRQGAALLWDMERRPQARATLVRQGVESIESLAFSSDGKWLATANSRSGTKLWDLEASSADRSPAVSGGALPSTAAIAFQPRGQLLACAQPDGSVRLFRKPGPQAAVLAATLPGHHGTVVALAMRPDGKLLATSGSDKSLRLWNLEAPETPPVELDCHSRVVTQLAFGTDGTRLLAGCSEGGAMLWEFRTDGGKPACVTMQAHALGVTAVYMTRDDKWAVTGGRSGDVRLWKLADLSLESLVLKKHSSEIDQIAGSPDGRMLVTIGQGDDPILWDLSLNDPGEHPSALGTQSFRATGVAFSDDGQHVVAASDKGFVRLWPATPKELLESAARNAVRNLTRREWEAALAPLPYERTFPNLPEPPDR